MNQKIREAVQDLTPYHAPYVTDGIKLDANENTYPILEQLKEHMAKWVKTMPINYYPDTESRKLREAIGAAYQLEADEVICGVGSDQLIDCILRTFIEKEDVVLAPAPSFSMYGLSTKLNEGRFVTVPLKADFHYDTEEMLVQIEKLHPKVLFICNPNNPTGTLLKQEAVEAMIQKMEGIVVIDEAYVEFHEDVMLPLLKKYDNVIILRTFSKAYGLAGARIGYGLANRTLIGVIDAIRPPYNINIFSQEVAHYVITHKEAFQEVIGLIKESRQMMREALCDMGFDVAPSATNFLWIKTKYPLDDILKDYKIYTKMFQYKEERYCRLSIGTLEENQKVLEILRQSIPQEERGI